MMPSIDDIWWYLCLKFSRNENSKENEEANDRIQFLQQVERTKRF